MLPLLPMVFGIICNQESVVECEMELAVRWLMKNKDASTEQHVSGTGVRRTFGTSKVWNTNQ